MAAFEFDKILIVVVCSKQAESQEEHSGPSYHYQQEYFREERIKTSTKEVSNISKLSVARG